MDVFDIAVLGLGAHGSSTMYFLSQQHPSLKILGIEKNTAGNQLGSSAGLSRIIRKAYFESPSYVQLLERSYTLYSQLEQHAAESQLSYSEHPQSSQFTPGHTLLHITGGLDIGPEDSVMVNGAIAACTQNGLPYEVLTPDQVAARWPITLPGDQYRAVYQKDGGFLEPEKTNFTMVKLAQTNPNTSLHFEHSVIDVEQTESGLFKIFMVPTGTLIEEVDITALKATASVMISKKILLCTGPWIQHSMKFSCFATQRNVAPSAQVIMFNKLDKFFDQTQTQVQRQVVNWHDVAPEHTGKYDSPNFPIFLVHHKYNYLTSSDESNPLDDHDSTKLLSASNQNTQLDENGNLVVHSSNTNAIDDRAPYDHFYYGFPSMRPGDESVKIGRYHHFFEDINQDELNRNCHFLDIMATAHCTKHFFPGVQVPQWYDQCIDFLAKNVDPTKNFDVEEGLSKAREKDMDFPQETSNVSLSRACTFTNTFDGHFLIQPMSFADAQQDDPNVLILSGCSGHGFKFSAVLGEICSDLLATGRSQFDLQWLSVDRVSL